MERDRSERTNGSMDGSDAERCVNCGDRIETGEWHPVETTRDDGEFVLLPFCTVACRDAWSDG